MHVQGRIGALLPRSSDLERQVTPRALIPPLTIFLTAVTALALVLTAAAITPPPTIDMVASPPHAAVSAAALPEASTSLARITELVLPPPPVVIDLARLLYAPGADGPSHALSGPLLLVVESGSLTAHLAGSGQLVHADRTAEAAEGTLSLRVGDNLVLPAATPAAFHNGGDVPVIALVAGVFPAVAVASGLGRIGPARWADAWSPGATVQPLVGGWMLDLPSGPSTVALRRMSLRPGDGVPLTAPGPAILAVETGALTLVADQGMVWRQPPDGPDTLVGPDSQTTLLPDDGALLPGEAGVTLRNNGSSPLQLLVLTVDPDGAV